MQSKYIKTHKQEIPSIGRNVLEIFCVSLHAEFLSNVYKKYQVASSCIKKIRTSNFKVLL